MKLVLRALPWLVTSCLALACESERAAEPAGAKAGAGENAGADAKAGAGAKAGANANADAKAGADANANAEVDAKADAKPTIEPPEPVSPRTVVFYREAPKERVKLWVLPEPTAADPAAARELGIVADPDGGDVYHGTTGPVLSGDGQWLAYQDQGRLEVARLDGTAKHRITKYEGNRVSVLISGFSPDSSRLMFHQGAVQDMEATPLPKDVVEGSHELVLADLAIVPRTSLEAFAAYTDDGRHVVFQRSLPDRSSALVRFDLDTGVEEQLQTTTDAFGFAQLVLRGERIAYLHHPAPGRSRIVADRLRGGARIEVSPEAKFAQLQWPRISLDGAHVSYTDETKLMVRTLAPDDAPRVLVTCATRHCKHAWDGATTAIVRDGPELSRVSLDGTITKLASDVVGFVIAGEPG